MWVIHAILELLLSNQGSTEYLLQFAFIPMRYFSQEFATAWPFANLYSPITYSFLHGNWEHLIINSIWMLAFGSVIARRIGNLRFILFCVVGSIAGAALHMIFHLSSFTPMIGASAVVSACTGAAMRFAFPMGRNFMLEAAFQPRRTILQTLQNRQALIFIVIWFAINLLFGTGLIDLIGEGSSVAWQAHIGGFVFGLLCFAPFDRAGNGQPTDPFQGGTIHRL